MNFKKTSAALMAATVLAVAAPMTGGLPATTAYAAETITEDGIVIKTNAQFAQTQHYDPEKEEPTLVTEDTTFYNDWRNTFEITAPADAFKDGSTCEVRLEYLVSFKDGMNAVAEISWDCDAIIDHSKYFNRSGAYHPETNIMDGAYGGGGYRAYSIDVLDGDIAPCLIDDYSGTITPSDKIPGDYFSEERWFEGLGEIEYHLGSKNGVDYIGAGKGVYATPAYGTSDDMPEYYSVENIHIVFNEPGTITITMKDRTAVTEPTTPADPTVSTKEQSFHDDTTDISVEGSFPEGTTLKTETKQTSDTKVSWEITPVDANGKTVQPNGTATVKVPLPEAFRGKDVFVYRIEDGKYTALESTIDGDYIVFSTNHFSEYILTTEKLDNTNKPSTDNPNTGVSAAAFGIVALAGAFVIVSRKKR